MERKKEVIKLFGQFKDKGLKDFMIISVVKDSRDIPGQRLTPEEVERLKGQVSLTLFSMLQFSDEHESTKKIPILIHRKDFKISYLYTGTDKQTEI